MDFESILSPEVWPAIAEEFKIEALHRTTKDEPNLDQLFKDRISTLRENNISFSEVQAVLSKLEPLEGAKDFLDWLKSLAPVVILTDGLDEMVKPILKQLDYPTAFSQQLIVGSDGYIEKHHFRLDDQKTKAVKAFQDLNYHVIAVGDSYNDLGMLHQANDGFLFQASEEIRNKENLPHATDYDQLKDHISSVIS